MLKMLEKSVRGGICHDIYLYKKANNKERKCYHKKESSYPKYLGVNNFHRWKMPRKFA